MPSLTSPRRFLHNAKAISPVVAMIIILAVTIAVAVAFAGVIYGWWSGASSIVQLDTSGTRLILRASDGYLKIQVNIKNVGTGGAQVKQILLDSNAGLVTITFTTGTPGGIATSISGCTGGIYASSGVNVDSNNNLNIPAGQSASIIIYKASGGTNYWTIGNNYHGTIQYIGGAIDFNFYVESY